MAQELVINYVFRKIAGKFPDKVCLQIEKDGIWEKYTYAEVEKLSHKVAAFLISEGIGKGDFVILMLDNCPEWAISYLGILQSGTCAVPVDAKATIKELKNITADCKPKAIFISHNIVSKDNFENLKQAFRKIVVIDSDTKNGNIINFSDIKRYDLPSHIEYPKLSPYDFASLIYTSGTTGTPKGVLLSHRNFCSNVRSFDILKIFTKDDIFLSLLPLFHSYAFMSGLLVPILIGATVSYCISFKSEDVARTVKDSGVTIMPTVPQFLTLLRNKIFLKYDESPVILKPLVLFFTRFRVRKIFGKALRLFLSGGARLDPVIANDMSKLGIVLIEGYGLTETSPVVALNPIEKIKFGSVGRPIPNVEVRINNPNESGIGEVVIKGLNVMTGYFKRPDSTREVIKDGWFYSGDLGYLDREGYLYITGRAKEVIVLSSGKNIYPGELEEAYNVSPYIKELCILSRDDQRGLHAVVVPDFSYFRQMNIMNIQATIKWELENISRELPAHNHILGFTVTKEDLPRTRLGKLKRFEIQEKYGKEEEYKKAEEGIYSEADLGLIKLDSSKKVLNFLNKKLKRKISLGDHLEIDLGIDSLGRIELADGLEGLLKVKIPNEFITRVFIVRELLNEIKNLDKEKTGDVTRKDAFNWKELLSKLPDAEVLKKVQLNPSIGSRMFTAIVPRLFLYLFKIFWSLKIEGRERLPHKGPYILCPNHASYLDGFIVAASIPYRIELHTFFLGYAVYFEHPLAAWGIKAGRLIPLDPNTDLVKAMQISAYVLRNGKMMCIFPAGRRSVDQKVQDFKKGVGILAKELNIPLIPVFIKGSHFAWPRDKRYPRPYPLKITYGYPLSVSEILCRAKEQGKDDYETIANTLREEVLKLSGN